MVAAAVAARGASPVSACPPDCTPHAFGAQAVTARSMVFIDDPCGMMSPGDVTAWVDGELVRSTATRVSGPPAQWMVAVAAGGAPFELRIHGALGYAGAAPTRQAVRAGAPSAHWTTTRFAGAGVDEPALAIVASGRGVLAWSVTLVEFGTTTSGRVVFAPVAFGVGGTLVPWYARRSGARLDVFAYLVDGTVVRDVLVIGRSTRDAVALPRAAAWRPPEPCAAGGVNGGVPRCAIVLAAVAAGLVAALAIRRRRRRSRATVP